MEVLDETMTLFEKRLSSNLALFSEPKCSKQHLLHTCCNLKALVAGHRVLCSVAASVILAMLAPNAFGDIIDKSRTNEALIGGLAQSAFEGLNEFTAASKYKKSSSPVGELEVKFAIDRDGQALMGFCTATLIDALYILTAQHCLKDEKNDANTVTTAVVWMGFDGDKTTAAPFKVHVAPVESDNKLDYAILIVDGNPAANYGVALLTDRAVSASEELFVISHPLGERKQLTRRLCRARLTDGTTLRHNCHTDEGSSGGPIFPDNDSSPRVVAIHRGSESFMGQQINEGTLISAIAQQAASLRAF